MRSAVYNFLARDNPTGYFDSLLTAINLIQCKGRPQAYFSSVFLEPCFDLSTLELF